MKQGVLTIAIGSAAYQKFAANLAVSIRAVSELPITLLTDREPFRPELFDKVIHIAPEDAYRFVMKDGHHRGIEPGRLKLNIDRYTPYDRTIYIDADSVASKDISEIFEVHDAPFVSFLETLIPTDHPGRHKHMIWAKMTDIHEYLSEGQMPALNSSIIVFDNRAQNIFSRARELHSKIEKYRKWGGAAPDELYFNIACNNYAQYFQAIKDGHFVKGNSRERNLNEYTILTMFGSNTQMSYHAKRCYKQLIDRASKETGHTAYSDINSLAKKKHVTANRA